EPMGNHCAAHWLGPPRRSEEIIMTYRAVRISHSAPASSPGRITGKTPRAGPVANCVTGKEQRRHPDDSPRRDADRLTVRECHPNVPPRSAERGGRGPPRSRNAPQEKSAIKGPGIIRVGMVRPSGGGGGRRSP